MLTRTCRLILINEIRRARYVFNETMNVTGMLMNRKGSVKCWFKIHSTHGALQLCHTYRNDRTGLLFLWSIKETVDDRRHQLFNVARNSLPRERLLSQRRPPSSTLLSRNHLLYSNSSSTLHCRTGEEMLELWHGGNGYFGIFLFFK